MGRAVTLPQDRTTVAGRQARALVFFCAGTCRNWSGRRSALVSGPCLPVVSRDPEERLRKGGRGGVLYAWMKWSHHGDSLHNIVHLKLWHLKTPPPTKTCHLSSAPSGAHATPCPLGAWNLQSLQWKISLKKKKTPSPFEMGSVLFKLSPSLLFFPVWCRLKFPAHFALTVGKPSYGHVEGWGCQGKGLSTHGEASYVD